MDYFKSEADKIAFALLECSGETRQTLLGITLFWYKNKKYQEKKKKELMLLLETHPHKEAAIAVLNNMFP